MNTVEYTNRDLGNVTTFLVGAGVFVQREQKLLMAPVEIQHHPVRNFEKKYYYDQTTPDEVVGRVYQEEGFTADIKKRIVKAGVYKEERINLDSWDFNEHSDSEMIATMNAFELAHRGCNMIFWISPSSESYKEGRLNIYLPTYKNGEWSVQGWGIPLLKNQDQSLRLGKGLVDKNGVVLEEFENVEDLRRQPVGFRIKNQENWLAECQELLPEFKYLWDFIAAGGEEANREEVLKAVVYAREKAGDNNPMFEQIMASLGFRINPEGSHGSAYGENGVYNFKITMVNGVPTTELQRIDGKLICPVCGVEVGEGVTVCPTCKVGLR